MVLASLLTGVAASAATLPSVTYDDDTKTRISLGENGNTVGISGVTGGQVYIGSTFVATGNDVYEVDKKISKFQSRLDTVDLTTSTINATLSSHTLDINTLKNNTATLKARVDRGYVFTINGWQAKEATPSDNEVNFKTGDNISITNDNGSLKFSVLSNGKVESGNTGLVSGDTVYQAIRGISGGSTKNALTYDDDTHSKITLDEGTVITGLKGGYIGPDSSDAVTGGQIYSKEEQYKAKLKAIDDTIWEQTKLTTNLIESAAQLTERTNAVEQKAGVMYNFLKDSGFGVYTGGKRLALLNMDNPTFNLSSDGSLQFEGTDTKMGKGVKVSVVANGAVVSGNEGLVTGGMVMDAINKATEGLPTDVNVANKADKDLSNLSTAGSDKISTIATDAAKAEVAGKADIDAGNIEVAIWQNKLDTVKTDGSNINLSAWQSRLGNGINAEGNTGLITGDTLYKALANVKGTTYTGSDTIAIGDDNSISVKANGKVETGNTGLVTGGQVKEAIAKATENMATDATIQGKADTKLSNITEEGKQVIKDTVKDDLAKKADQSYVDTKVSDAVKDKVTQEELKAGLDKKADADLSNISEAGKQVIKDTMKDDLDKKADQSYVDSQVKDINDKLSGKADTSYVDAALKDKVSKDELAASVANKADKTYVNDQVSNAVKDKVTKTELSDGLATKADKTELETKAATDASNLTDENVKAWSGKLGIGTVQENDTGLVTGDAVYKAISQVDVNNGMISSDDKTIQVGKNSEAASVDFTNAKGEQRVLTGIKTDAEDATSAANVGYVQANVEGVYQNVNTAMDRMYNKLDKNMNKGVAGASALAALKPLDYDPDDRLSFAVGYGHYKGANAAALGAFYRPNENTMINAGVSLGNGSNAVNAGVAFKVGKGSAYAGLSKAEMAAALVDQGKKIDSLEKDNAELRQKLEEILAKLK